MSSRRTLLSIGTAFSVLGAIPFALCPVARAARPVDQHQPAEASGTVEIVNVAGSVTVTGWDKPEVAVAGEIGDRVERVEVTSADHRTVVRVVLPQGSNSHGKGDDGSAALTVHVPNRSSLEVSLVAANLTVSGVSGSQQLRTVSGNIISDGGGTAHINSVSGNVRLTVPDATPAQVESISGDVVLKGAGGDVSITTMNGNGDLTLGSLHGFNLHTVSGNFDIHARLDASAQFSAQSVSGNVSTQLAGPPGAEFDLNSLSGDIRNCTAQKAIRSQYGPGSRLNFSTGDGQAHVHMSSTSGDLSLCAR